ncbi:MAG: T9SS C-terminal target domain-containing protein [Cytophagales bacterium]|nr:MAG: T9SS C-terminal target domain-containing protein [Cytophagales bacterium]
MTKRISLKAIFTLSVIVFFSQSSISQQLVTIDKSKQYQTVEGFGTLYGKYVYWDGDGKDYYDEDHLKRIIDDLQISIHRTFLDTKMEMVNDNNDPNVTDLAKYRAALDLSAPDRCSGEYIKNRTILNYMKAYKERALKNGDTLKFFATVMSPPHWMKYTRCTFGTDFTWNRMATWEDEAEKGTTGGVDGVKDFKDEFAEFVYGTTKVFQENGINFHGVSIQNEPQFPQTYNSCIYNFNAMAATVKTVGKRLEKEKMNTKIMFPEDMGDVARNNQYVMAVNKDADALKYSDIFAVHQYNQDGVTSGTIGASQWEGLNKIANRGRKRQVWMTETSNFGTGVQGLRKMSSQLFTALKFGYVNAWIWLIACDNSGPDEDGYQFFVKKDGKQVWTKKGLAFKHYCKYIRPNSIMVDALSSAPNEVLSLAFQDNYRKRLTIVLVNNDSVNSKTVSLKFVGSGYPSKFLGFRTSSIEDFKNLDSLKATDIITLPPSSIATFIGNNSMPVITGVNDIEENNINKIVIYPNPSQNIINLIGKGLNEEHIEILDSQMKTIVLQSINFESNEAQVDISSLVNGIYFVKIKNQVKKIVVAK